MPAREHLRVVEDHASIYLVHDIRTDPPTPLGAIGRVLPDGFDLLPRWNSIGLGSRFRTHETPYSSVEGALEAFIGPDEAPAAQS